MRAVCEAQGAEACYPGSSASEGRISLRLSAPHVMLTEETSHCIVLRIPCDGSAALTMTWLFRCMAHCAAQCTPSSKRARAAVLTVTTDLGTIHSSIILFHNLT